MRRRPARIWSLLLTLCMVFTMLLPGAAWAANLEQYTVTVGHNVPDPKDPTKDWKDSNWSKVAEAYAYTSYENDSQPEEDVWETLQAASGDTVNVNAISDGIFHPHHFVRWDVLEGNIQLQQHDPEYQNECYFVMPEENVKLQAIFEPCHFEFLGEKDAEKRIVLKDAKVGEAYSQKIEYDTCWEELYLSLDEDELPQGMTFDEKTGVISGTTEISGVYPITVRAWQKRAMANALSLEEEEPPVEEEYPKSYVEQAYVLYVYDEVEMPVEKIVEKGGSYAPEQETFTFEVEFPSYLMEAPEFQVKLEDNTITSSGTGTFTGTLKLKADLWLDMFLLEEGVKLHEVKGSAANWTYSDKVYLVMYEETDPQQDLTLVFYDITKAQPVEGDWQYDLTSLASSDTASFTNTYTRNSSGGGGGDSSTYYRLTYESNGGTEYTMERYLSGKNVELDKKPTRKGYTFTGWYEDKALKTEITSVKMTADKTVYAGWEANEGKPEVPEALNGEEHFAYLSGYEDGLVRPTRNITRAEAASIIYRLLQKDVREDNTTVVNSFADVPAGEWYHTAVSTMAAMGIMDGRTALTFEPNAPITRAELASAFARFDTTKPEKAASFSDIAGHKLESEIQQAAALGWVKGYEDGTFHPDALITRAEAVTLINTVLQRLPQDTDSLLEGMVTWADNLDTSAWYYLALQEAGNTHEYEKHGQYEDWTQLVR